MGAAIGFIGVGNMGSAIIRGLAQDTTLTLHGIDLDQAKLKVLAKECGLTIQKSIKDLVGACDYVLLAVKPQHAEETLKEAASALKGKVLLSIAAGIPQERLKAMSGGKCPVVRVMPNTPALVGEGVFALCLDDARLKKPQKDFLTRLFGRLGQVHVLPEKLFDAFTAVIGSGPAYVFAFMEALVDAAVFLGLPRDAATAMVKGLFTGSARLAAESPMHLAQLRDMVTSPGGTTIRALQHMDRMAVSGSIVDAVIESFDRSVELGKK